MSQLTSEQALLLARELSARFAVDAAANDLAGGRPLSQLAALRESGLLTALIPEAYGGPGLPWSTVLRVARELASGDSAMGHLYGYHFLALSGVLLRGSEAQRQRLLGASAREHWFWGNSVNTFSHSLFGQRSGEDHVLNGYRPFSSGSHIADRLLVAWEDQDSDVRFFGSLAVDQPGITLAHDWDGFGQRQTGSGRVLFENVRIPAADIYDAADSGADLFPSLGAVIAQQVLIAVFVGTAWGALRTARDYTREHSRPWITSGVERHGDDPWVRRVYGELYTSTLAAEGLADRSLALFDQAWAQGSALTSEARGEVAVATAAANVFAGDTALDVTSRIFEVMGARSATKTQGFDRFWRNVRTHTLHNPAEYKTRNVGNWYLNGDYPEPGIYQ